MEKAMAAKRCPRTPYTAYIETEKTRRRNRSPFDRYSLQYPPEGRSRWTLRLLADQIVTMGYVESISHESVRQVLKKTNLSLG